MDEEVSSVLLFSIAFSPFDVFQLFCVYHVLGQITHCYGHEINLVDFLPKVSSQIHLFWPMYVLYFIEICFLLVDIFLAIFLLKLLFTTVVWHKNLTYVVSLLVIIQIPGHFGRIIFIYYTVANQFRTDYCNGVLIVTSYSQMMYAFVMAHASGGFLIERLFALYHLKDYERKSRRYIPAVIVLFILTAGVYFVYSNTVKKALEFFALYVVGIVLANILLFFVIILWNKKLIFRVSLSANLKDYSLNKRFQLAENIRVLHLCKNTAIVSTAWITVVCGVLIYMDTFGWNPYGLMVFELVKSSCPLGVMITVMWSMPKWKEETMNLILRRKEQKNYVQKSLIDETELYFNQLKDAWNAPKQHIFLSHIQEFICRV